MNGIVDARDFSNALSRVMKLAARRSAVPILEQVKIDFTETTCTLTATDLEQWGVVELPAQGEKFSFVLGNAKEVLKMLDKQTGALCFSTELAEKLPITCKRLLAKRVSAPEVFASDSAVVSCHLSAAYVETGRLTVALNSIDEVIAEEIINLTPKKRSLFGTLLASAFRAFWLSHFAKPAKSDSPQVLDAEYTPVEETVPPEEVAEPVSDEAIPEDGDTEENDDFELRRIVAQFKLARASGYTLRLIPGTPEENAPVFDFGSEQVVRPAA